jgi:quercetin dioxygenase-like cupin family protein
MNAGDIRSPRTEQRRRSRFVEREYLGTDQRSRGFSGRGHIKRKEKDVMSSKQASSWRRVALAGAIAGAFSLGATSAFAGECAAADRRPDGTGQKPGATAPKDVTDVVITTTDLAKEKVALKDRLFRFRRLDIKPGGVVPWHSHDNRPAMIYVVKGTIVEYASTCAVPIVHKAGDVSPERIGTSHWWKNTGTEDVVLVVSDIFPVEDKVNEKMM